MINYNRSPYQLRTAHKTRVADLFRTKVTKAGFKDKRVTSKNSLVKARLSLAGAVGTIEHFKKPKVVKEDANGVNEKINQGNKHVELNYWQQMEEDYSEIAESTFCCSDFKPTPITVTTLPAYSLRSQSRQQTTPTGIIKLPLELPVQSAEPVQQPMPSRPQFQLDLKKLKQHQPRQLPVDSSADEIIVKQKQTHHNHAQMSQSPLGFNKRKDVSTPSEYTAMSLSARTLPPSTAKIFTEKPHPCLKSHRQPTGEAASSDFQGHSASDLLKKTIKFKTQNRPVAKVNSNGHHNQTGSSAPKSKSTIKTESFLLIKENDFPTLFHSSVLAQQSLEGVADDADYDTDGFQVTDSQQLLLSQLTTSVTNFVKKDPLLQIENLRNPHNLHKLTFEADQQNNCQKAPNPEFESHGHARVETSCLEIAAGPSDETEATEACQGLVTHPRGVTFALSPKRSSFSRLPRSQNWPKCDEESIAYGVINRPRMRASFNNFAAVSPKRAARPSMDDTKSQVTGTVLSASASQPILSLATSSEPLE